MSVREWIRQLDGYQTGAASPHGKSIRLHTNELPCPPPPAVQAAIAEAATRLRRYPDPLATAFRMAAAETLGVEPEQILCGAGSDDLLRTLMIGFVEPGAGVATLRPDYPYYGVLAELQQARQYPV